MSPPAPFPSTCQYERTGAVNRPTTARGAPFPPRRIPASIEISIKLVCLSVTVNEAGEVHLICLHPQCQLRGVSNRRPIGFIPLSLLPDTEALAGNQAVGERERIQYRSSIPRQIHSLPKWSGQVRTAQNLTAIDSTAKRQAAPTSAANGIENLTEDHATQQCASIANVPPESAIRPKRHLTMRQSFAKIERENQNLRLAADQEPSFDAWVQEPGAWGG